MADPTQASATVFRKRRLRDVVVLPKELHFDEEHGADDSPLRPPVKASKLEFSRDLRTLSDLGVDPRLLRYLHANGYRTLESILSESDTHSWSQRCPFSECELDELQSTLIDGVHPRSLAMRVSEMRSSILFGTGDPELDAFIPHSHSHDHRTLDPKQCGGFESGRMYELCGASQTGKTELCYRVISEALTRDAHSRVYFVDCARQFSGVRLEKVARRMLQTTVRSDGIDESDVISSILQRTIVLQCQTAAHLDCALGLIDDQSDHRCSLIVIDALPSCLVLSGIFEQKVDECEQIGRRFKWVSVRLECPILWTNLVTLQVQQPSRSLRTSTAVISSDGGDSSSLLSSQEGWKYFVKSQPYLSFIWRDLTDYHLRFCVTANRLVSSIVYFDTQILFRFLK